MEIFSYKNLHLERAFKDGENAYMLSEETVGPNYIFKIWRKKICPNIISESLWLVRLKIIAFLLYPVQHFTDSERYVYPGDKVKEQKNRLATLSYDLLHFIQCLTWNQFTYLITLKLKMFIYFQGVMQIALTLSGTAPLEQLQEQLFTWEDL